MQSINTIYLVDEDDSARNGLTKFLTVARFHVESFSSVEEFRQIEAIENNACLIIDAGQQGLLNIDLQEFFSHKDVSLPIIFISASDDRTSRKRAVQARAAGFFRKPVDGPALLDAISWEIGVHERKIETKDEKRS